MVFGKKIISFSMLIAIVASLLIPVSAADAQWARTGIYAWNASTGGGFSSREEYDSYVQDLNEQFGTTTFGLNALYVGDWHLGSGTSAAFALTSGPTFHVTGTVPTSGAAYVGLSVIGSFIAPVSGEYRLKYFSTGTTWKPIAYIMQGDAIIKQGGESTFKDSFWLNLEAGTQYTIKLSDTVYAGNSVDYSGCVAIEMPTGMNSGVDVSKNSRPTSFNGPVGYYNEDNGNLEVVGDNNTTFVDESNNTYHSPVTDESINMTDWYYDYSDRSYHITTEEGDTVTVTYGDENITINEGGNTYNYYYLVESDPDGDSSSSGGHAHNYTNEVTKEPTCLISGIRTYICSCGESYSQSIPATGHDWEISKHVPNTYDPETGEQIQAGYTVYVCNSCGDQFKATDGTAPPNSGSGNDGSGSGNTHTHVYTSVITKKPSCLINGIRTYTCLCGDSYTSSISAIGHDWVISKQVPSTYDPETGDQIQAGYTVYVCGTCGEHYKSTTGTAPPSGTSGGFKDIIIGLLSVIGEIIGGLLEGALVLATKALEALTGLGDLFAQMIETILGFFGGFLDFLSAVFPFLPEETITILNFGLILMIAAAVFNKFFK